MKRKGQVFIHPIAILLLLLLAVVPVWIYFNSRANLEVRFIDLPNTVLFGSTIKTAISVRNNGPAEAKSVKLDLLIQMGSRTESKSWSLGNMANGYQRNTEEYSFLTIPLDIKFTEPSSGAAFKVNANAENGQGSDSKQVTLQVPVVKLTKADLPNWNILARRYTLKSGEYPLKELEIVYQGNDPKTINLAYGIRTNATVSSLKYFSIASPVTNPDAVASKVIWILSQKQVDTEVRTWTPDLAGTRFQVSTNVKAIVIDIELVVLWVESPGRYVSLTSQTFTIEIQMS